MRTLLFSVEDLPWGLRRPLRDFRYPGCALGQSCKASALGLPSWQRRKKKKEKGRCCYQCYVAVNITVGLASHQPCITDLVIYPPMVSVAYIGRWALTCALEGHGAIYVPWLTFYFHHSELWFTYAVCGHDDSLFILLGNSSEFNSVHDIPSSTCQKLLVFFSSSFFLLYRVSLHSSALRP